MKLTINQKLKRIASKHNYVAMLKLMSKTPEQRNEQILKMTALKLELEEYSRGLCNESGEVSSHIYKYLQYNAPISAEKMIKELGDCFFYFRRLMIALSKYFGFTLTMRLIKRVNMDKLLTRYSNGFSEKEAVNRIDV